MSLKKPIQLLHVDDSATLRKTVERGLAPFQEHYVLTQASSVDEALGLMNSGKKFDVILTDWLMNHKSGLDLLMTLKSTPEYHQLPVFFLTSEHDVSSLTTAVSYGASGLLKKPVTGPEIHAYFQKKSPVIEESFVAKEDTFSLKALPLLHDFKQMLPLKNPQDLANAFRCVQILKALTSTSKWPLLTDYCLKMEGVIQETTKKGVSVLSPMTALLTEFHGFMEQAHAEIQNGNPHAFMSPETEKGLKNYLENLKSGWFAQGEVAPAAEGLLLPWDVVTELQKHLNPEGLALLEKHLPLKKAA